MLYCTHRDQPMPQLATGVQVLIGCNIFGIHHDCEGCPNLKEMGDNPSNGIKATKDDK